MEIHNRVPAELPHKVRKLKAIKSLVVHRIMDREEYFAGPEAVVAAFEDTSKYAAGSYTGGKTPYHFFLDRSGRVFQLLPLTRIGPGAAGINTQSIHIALSGDFRVQPPSTGQLHGLKGLLVKLQLMLGDKEVRGHTERGFSGKVRTAIGKQCPGKQLNLDAVRTQVKLALTLKRAQNAYGVII
jgi:N-acetyl-anhydromuramyl-L-alanine amidase AmpD